MLKILFFLAVFGYVVYRFGRKIYHVARIIAGVGDAIAQKQAQQQAKNPPPQYHDKESNMKVYASDKNKRKDFSDGEYIDYEEVK